MVCNYVRELTKADRTFLGEAKIHRRMTGHKLLYIALPSDELAKTGYPVCRSLAWNFKRHKLSKADIVDRKPAYKIHSVSALETDQDPLLQPSASPESRLLALNIQISLISNMTGQPRLKVALIGLGRLGVIRARILAFQQPRIELVAACDTKPGSDEWVKANLSPSIRYFADPEECMKNSGAKAVLISTATATHAPLIMMALDLGLVSRPIEKSAMKKTHNSQHVMCEKPISADVATTQVVVAKAASKPDQKFLVPFCRRCG